MEQNFEIPIKSTMRLKLCRLCQNTNGTISIKENPELIETIRIMTNIVVNDALQDQMPKYVCYTCQRILIDTHRFVEMVQKVDEGLRKLVIKQKYSADAEGSHIKLDVECLSNVLKNGKKPVKCPVCSKQYRRTNSFERHKKTHSGLYCSCCGTLYNTKEERDKHTCKAESKTEIIPNNEKQISEPPPFDGECVSDNDTKFSGYSEECGTYICQHKDCAKIFPSNSKLNKHEIQHSENKPYLCVTCGKTFLTKNCLNSHENGHLNIFRCIECNLSFSFRSNLRAHIRKHHEGVKFYCSQCPKEFLGKTSLERHEKIHVGVKEFKCKECTSSFYTRKELVKHQRYHKGLKRHKCELCFKTFFERHHLIVHLRSHTGERPYACKVPGCGKSFTESQKLKRHHKALHSIVK